MTYAEHRGTWTALSVATILTLGFSGLSPVFGYDPAQSTGTGTVQEEDGSVKTQRGGHSGTNTGRNEHSGSATGAVRDPQQSEPKADKNRGSHQLGSDSGHEANKGKNEGKAQAGAPKGK